MGGQALVTVPPFFLGIKEGALRRQLQSQWSLTGESRFPVLLCLLPSLHSVAAGKSSIFVQPLLNVCPSVKMMRTKGSYGSVLAVSVIHWGPLLMSTAFRSHYCGTTLIWAVPSHKEFCQSRG